MQTKSRDIVPARSRRRQVWQQASGSFHSAPTGSYSQHLSFSGPVAGLAVFGQPGDRRRFLIYLAEDQRQHDLVLQVQYSGRNMLSGFCVTLCRSLLTPNVFTGHGIHSDGSCSAV